MAAESSAERLKGTNDPDRAPEVEVFYDGACPLCAREIAMLRRLDRGRGRIRFTDIAAAGFDPASVGVSWAALMREIHGRLPDGRLIVDPAAPKLIQTPLGN